MAQLFLYLTFVFASTLGGAADVQLVADNTSEQAVGLAGQMIADEENDLVGGPDGDNDAPVACCAFDFTVARQGIATDHSGYAAYQVIRSTPEQYFIRAPPLYYSEPI